MRDPNRLSQLYMKLYHFHVQYGDDKTVSRLFYDIACLPVFSIEDDVLFPELYKQLGVVDTNRCATESYLGFYEVLCGIHRERCPDMRIGQLIVCLKDIAEECLKEPAGVFLKRISEYLK